MEIWQYLETLRRPNKQWLFLKDNTVDRINALTTIAAIGHSNVIGRLIEFLKDRNSEIRQVTCSTIVHLFKKVNGKKGYYNSVKYCNISQ